MRYLEKDTRVEEIPQPPGLVIDGMAFVRLVQRVGLTFNKLVDTILQRAFSLIINASHH